MNKNKKGNSLVPPAPPLIIRQQPPRPITPQPLVIREAPPPVYILYITIAFLTF